VIALQGSSVITSTEMASTTDYLIYANARTGRIHITKRSKQMASRPNTLGFSLIKTERRGGLPFNAVAIVGENDSIQK
jgi:hypothetical protein